MMSYLRLFLGLWAGWVCSSLSDSSLEMGATSPPNIIFILMDDFGYADFHARGAEFETPNLDELYKESIVLEYHYAGLLCSPSRGQMLTGRYAWNMGISGLKSFGEASISSIPIGMPFISDILNEYTNYKSYALGKWQLGYSTKYHTPLFRGFDQFYGYYTNGLSYTAKTSNFALAKRAFIDWRANEKVDYDTMDTFSTFVTGNYLNQIIDENTKNPSHQTPFYIYAALQANHAFLEHVESENSANCDIINTLYEDSDSRLKTCQNTLAVDQIIGSMMDKLKQNGVWDNTLIVFTSDNGGSSFTHSGSCNFPLRGGKETYFEGGIRTLAFVGGGYVPPSERGSTRDAFFHGVDWVPTLLSIAGVDVADVSERLERRVYDSQAAFDGHDFSKYLLYGHDSDAAYRADVPLSINDFSHEEADSSYDVSIIFTSQVTGHVYKLMKLEEAPLHVKICGQCRSSQGLVACESNRQIAVFKETLLLFDLTDDPRETHNLCGEVDGMDCQELEQFETYEEYDANAARKMEENDGEEEGVMVAKLWFEAKEKVLKYQQESSLYNEFISCARDQLESSDPTKDTLPQEDLEYASADAFSPWFSFDEYVDQFYKQCGAGEVNDALVKLYVNKYVDLVGNEEMNSNSKPDAIDYEEMRQMAQKKQMEQKKETKENVGGVVGEWKVRDSVGVVGFVFGLVAMLVVLFAVFNLRRDGLEKTDFVVTGNDKVCDGDNGIIANNNEEDCLLPPDGDDVRVTYTVL